MASIGQKAVEYSIMFISCPGCDTVPGVEIDDRWTVRIVSWWRSSNRRSERDFYARNGVSSRSYGYADEMTLLIDSKSGLDRSGSK